MEKLKEAEDSHGTLQAQCDQYRTVLAETVRTYTDTTCPIGLPSPASLNKLEIWLTDFLQQKTIACLIERDRGVDGK